MIARRLFGPLLLLLLATSAAQAKGVTAKIVISSDEFEAPIVITDPSTLERFNVWSGPSSGWLMPDGEVQPDFQGIFMDFPAGLADERPPGLVQFSVVFHLADNLESSIWNEAYHVEYAMTPGRRGGFFYLPTSNQHIIRHGVEGNWLHSTEQWEEAVRPLIEERLTSNE